MNGSVDGRVIYAHIDKSLGGGLGTKKIKKILSPGKCLRPRFLYHFAKPKYQKSSLFYPLASALECLHLYTLVHDDIIDNDTTRRGIPTLNGLFGNNQAIILGDIVRAGINSLILKSLLTPQEKIYSLEILTETDRVVNEGQLHQEEVETKPNTFSQAIWESVVWEKTGVLFWAAIALGNPAGDQALMREIGKHIGFLLQTKDDIWDFDLHQDANRAFSDLRSLSLNWLIIEGKRRIPGFMKKVKNAKVTKDFQAIADLLKKAGVVESAEQKAINHKKKILTLLPKLRVSKENAPHIERELDAILVIKTKYKK